MPDAWEKARAKRWAWGSVGKLKVWGYFGWEGVGEMFVVWRDFFFFFFGGFLLLFVFCYNCERSRWGLGFEGLWG